MTFHHFSPSSSSLESDMDLEQNSPHSSSSPSSSSSTHEEGSEYGQIVIHERSLFKLALTVSIFTLAIAGVCFYRGIEDILATQGPASTMLSSKSKLHRHLVKKEHNKDSVENDATPTPSKSQFKDLINSPLSLFIPFFASSSTFTTQPIDEVVVTGHYHH